MPWLPRPFVPFALCPFVPLSLSSPPTHDLVIIGAGAAGLMCAIAAGRTARAAGRPLRIVALDGAKTLGAKILVAGGGRCNVTHERVDERDYAGSTPPAIRKVLGALPVAETIAFFREIGVELKREDTGKLFPTTDRARTVLDGLITECRRLSVELLHPWRVGAVERLGEAFVVREAAPPPSEAGLPFRPLRTLIARRVVLCTGGLALPRSGSDGAGYAFARALGHTTTPRIFPALAPLVVHPPHFIHDLSGVAAPARLSVASSTGKVLAAFTGPVLCTHFGLSGPAALNVSRHLTAARADDPGAALHVNWLAGAAPEAVETALRDARSTPILRWLTSPPHALPERLARALMAHAGLDPVATTDHLAREQRKALVDTLTRQVVPVKSDRGFTYAEATAGGVPLSELILATLESRRTPGVHLAGEICDVDGRLGGFNFQWAWASGLVAGRGAAQALLSASKAV